MIGNDDCGQMSAWYILSTLGFYPVNPVNGEFVLGNPQVKKATIKLSKGKIFAIEANNYSTSPIYNEQQLLNGKTLKTHFICYSDIMKGGMLTFEMTNQ
jgi:putative alpha-1,2-mannosidase